MDRCWIFSSLLVRKTDDLFVKGIKVERKGEPDTVACQILDILHSVACPKYRL
jgi:hypothetical protein